MYEPFDMPTYDFKVTGGQFMETLQTLKHHHLFFNVVLPGKVDEPLDSPLTSQILAHFTSHNLVLPPDPNPGSGDIHFHQWPWVLMQPKL